MEGIIEKLAVGLAWRPPTRSGRPRTGLPLPPPPGSLTRPAPGRRESVGHEGARALGRGPRTSARARIGAVSHTNDGSGVDSPVSFTQTWPIVQTRSRATALPATGLIRLVSLALLGILI